MKASHSYLINIIASFHHICRNSNIDDVTTTADFEKYKKGLRRDLNGDSFPNAKHPITSEMMDKFTKVIDPEDLPKIKDMTMFNIMFYGFLRFNELCHITAH